MLYHIPTDGTQYYLYLTKYNNINELSYFKKTSKNHKYPQIILLHMRFVSLYIKRILYLML